MKIKETIENQGLSKVIVNKVEDRGNYYLVTVFGGFEKDTNNWGVYLKQIREIIKTFKDSYVMDLSYNCLCDRWILKFVIKKND